MIWRHPLLLRIGPWLRGACFVLIGLVALWTTSLLAQPAGDRPSSAVSSPAPAADQTQTNSDSARGPSAADAALSEKMPTPGVTMPLPPVPKSESEGDSPLRDSVDQDAGSAPGQEHAKSRLDAGAAAANENSPGSGASRQAPTNPKELEMAPLAVPAASTAPGTVEPGAMSPVPNLTQAEFQAWKGNQGAGGLGGQPLATLQQVTLIGQTLRQAVELEATLEIHVHESNNGWVSIPLGLREAAWQAPPKYSGNGEHIVHFDPEADEYRCWIKAAPNTQHRLTARLLLPLTGSGPERRLEFNLPLAGATSLKLLVPAPVVTVLESSGTPDPEITQTAENQSQIEVLGLKGEYVLAWRELAANANQMLPQIEATGAQLIRIDGRTISTAARLILRGYGAEFERVRVKLPPKSILTSGSGKGYAVSTVAGTNGEIVEVLFDVKTLGPIEVRLQTERILDVNNPNENLDVAGFQVQEALPHRQGGQIAVSVVGDWRLTWDKQSRVRPIAAFGELTNSRDFSAIWEYVGQPYELELRVAPRRTVLAVDAAHQLRLREREALLETTLKYNIRGARAGAVSVDLRGWNLEEVSPIDLVNSAAIETEGSGLVQIPLAAPALGNFELKLKARRNDIRPERQNAIPLPVVVADIPGNLTLEVTAAENLELEPVPGQHQQLSQLLNTELPVNPGAISWNYRLEGQPALFSARLLNRPKIVQGVNLAECRLSPTELFVRQDLEFHVPEAPIAQLQVAAPESLLRQTTLAWELDGLPVKPSGPPAWDAPGKRWVWTFSLPQPRGGVIPLTVSYRALQNFTRQATAKLQFALFVPIADQHSRQEVSLQAAPGLRLGTETLNADWKVLPLGERADGTAIRLVADQPRTDLSVTVQTTSAPRAGWSIERGWVQTWISENERQERAVYQLRGWALPEKILLPSGASGSDAQVLWNGAALAVELSGDSELRLPTTLPFSLGTESGLAAPLQQLEIRYRYTTPPGLWSLEFQAPRLVPGAWHQQLYWQILVPPRWHLINDPANWQPEAHWNWQGGYWGRSPTLTQTELENWSGAVTENPLPASVNSYLFSGIGELDHARAWFAPRWLLTWVGGLVGFGLGVALWRFAILRHPLSLIVGGLVLVSLGMAWPEPLILGGQTLLVGLPLLLIAGLLRRILGAPPTPQTTATPERGSSLNSQLLKPLGGALPHSGSTATVNLPVTMEPQA
ncbi:MAG: hypothetical protein SFX18_04805 [Pirellulales bacterium]|nr:hypothetical protein [Pirellulales bacterium]